MINIEIKIPIGKKSFLKELNTKLTDRDIRLEAEINQDVGYYIPRWDEKRLRIVFDYYYSNDVLGDTLDVEDVDLTTLEYYD